MRVREGMPGNIIQEHARTPLERVNLPQQALGMDAIHAALLEEVNSESERWKEVTFHAGGPRIDLVDANPANEFALM